MVAEAEGSLVGLRCGAELREDVGHLEGGADGLGALVGAGLSLLERVDGENAEGDGDAGLESGELQAEAASPEMYSKWAVSPRITQPRATMHE